jgi:hypothetical protein
MVIPLLLAGAAGVGIGSFLTGLLGGSKKDMETQAVQGATTTIEPYAYYSPTSTDARQFVYTFNPSYQISSPGAYANTSVATTKKDTVTQEPTLTPTLTTNQGVSPTQSDTPSAMTEFLPVLLIAGAVVVAMVVLK